LTVQIAALRRLLSEATGGDRWIETMPRRGYRFVGPVATEIQKVFIEAPPPFDAAPELAPTPDEQPERRQISVMSCALTEMGGRAGGMDLEDRREAVRALQCCVSTAADRHRGFI